MARRVDSGGPRGKSGGEHQRPARRPDAPQTRSWSRRRRSSAGTQGREQAVSDLARRQSIVDNPKANWAGGLTLFAGIILLMQGIFGFLQGFSALRKDDVFANPPKYLYEFDLTTWGWVHIIISVVAIVIGGAVLTLRTWGLIGGIVIAVITAVANFLFIPRSTVSSVLMVGLSVAVVWAFAEVIRETRELKDV
jgi:hypothetical protein